MKGVNYVRVTFLPESACLEDGCGWLPAGLLDGRRIRSQAERHVQKTGHSVAVDIVDRTVYSPQKTGGES